MNHLKRLTIYLQFLRNLCPFFLFLMNFCPILLQLLQRKEYFGQYGKITKMSLSRTAGGAVQQFVNDSCSV